MQKGNIPFSPILLEKVNRSLTLLPNHCTDADAHTCVICDLCVHACQGGRGQGQQRLPLSMVTLLHSEPVIAQLATLGQVRDCITHVFL